MESLYKENIRHISKNYKEVIGTDNDLFPSVLTLLPKKGTFIEIGSRRGEDHCRVLSEMGWSGTCVEANPEIANGPLHNNYKSNDLVDTYNYFISDKQGSIKFYIEKTENSGVSSAFYERATGIDSGINRTIKKVVDVKTITLNELNKKINKPHCDLLMTDTEGYDATILLSTDFSKFRPSIVMSETTFCYYHKHPYNKLNAGCIYNELVQHMGDSGYKIILSNNDLEYKKKYCPELIDIPMNTVWIRE